MSNIENILSFMFLHIWARNVKENNFCFDLNSFSILKFAWKLYRCHIVNKIKHNKINQQMSDMLKSQNNLLVK